MLTMNTLILLVFILCSHSRCAMPELCTAKTQLWVYRTIIINIYWHQGRSACSHDNLMASCTKGESMLFITVSDMLVCSAHM